VLVEPPRRPLILVAHPDDETIACGGLLQRVATALVIFATDGAPARYRFEPKFGTLTNYSQLRFQEASRALALVPNCAFRRLVRSNGSYFRDQHLFHDLRDAVLAVGEIAREFCPDVLVSHAYEGGHLDHDACSFIAMHAAAALSLPRFEFPLYSRNESGKLAYQQFRDVHPDVLELRLTAVELACKAKMAMEYHTQQGAFDPFDLGIEPFRPASGGSFSLPACRDYPYEGRKLGADVLLEKFAEFEARQRNAVRT
jgi:N-acetylglucosamine malate deacetylase 2